MEWISVTDKLPEKDKDLLVCTDTFYMGIGWYYHETQKWDLEIQKHTEADLGEVIYWIYVPAPPDVTFY